MTAIYNYKTTSVGGTTGKPQTGGKSDVTSSSGTPSATDNYMDQLQATGQAKMGKTPATGSESGDPVADLLTQLDQISGQGVPDGSMVPFAKISAEDALSKFPDAPGDVLSKFNSIVSILEGKIATLGKALDSGTGTFQQIQAGQKLKSDLQDLLTYYKTQRDKVADIVPQKEKAWTQELKAFQAGGGADDARKFDADGDGWIGQPEAAESYRIGTRTFDESYTDDAAKKLHDAGATLQFKFKKGDVQYWAMKVNADGTFGNRVQFDPKTKKVIGDQTANETYVADMGAGFGDPNASDIKLDDNGQIVLHTGDTTNAANFAEAGLELHTPEYLYVEVDSDGNAVENDKGHYNIAPFKMENGHLIQDIPPTTGDVKYKQIYVTKMKVQSVSPDGKPGGDIKIQLNGGADVDNSTLMTMVIKGNDPARATDTALAITSGKDSGHRETPVILDAGGYQSTCKQGISDPSSVSDEFANLSGQSDSNAAIQDTFKNLMAGSGGNGEIDSLLNRGISFKTKGHITGTKDNDLFVVEEPESYLTPDDAAYATIIDGQGGHNALLGGKGSLFASGMTLVDKDSKDADDEISIGVNAFGEVSSNGTLVSNMGKGSNKLYIHVNAQNSNRVAIQSVADGIDDKSKDSNIGQGDDPTKGMGWVKGDDDYDIRAQQVATTAIDLNNPNLTFDPDLAQKSDGTMPIQGALTTAAAGDFAISGSIYSKKSKDLDESIKKPATDTTKNDWSVEGATVDWMQGKYYQGDKNTLDTFFSGFSASKLNSVDPFQQLADGEKQASGGSI